MRHLGYALVALHCVILLTSVSQQSPLDVETGGQSILLRRGPPTALTHNADLGAILGKAVYATRCVGEACIVRVPAKTGNAFSEGFRKMGKWFAKQKESFVREATKPTPAKKKELRRMHSGREASTQPPHSPQAKHLRIADEPRRHSSAGFGQRRMSDVSDEAFLIAQRGRQPTVAGPTRHSPIRLEASPSSRKGKEPITPSAEVQSSSPREHAQASASRAGSEKAVSPTVSPKGRPTSQAIASTSRAGSEKATSPRISPKASPERLVIDKLGRELHSKEVKSASPIESEARAKIDSTEGLGDDTPPSPHRLASPGSPLSPQSPLIRQPNGIISRFPEIEVSSSPELSPTSARALTPLPEARVSPPHSTGRTRPYAVNGLEEAKDVGVHVDTKGIVHLYDKHASPNGPPHILKKQKSVKAKIKKVLFRSSPKAQQPKVTAYRSFDGQIFLVPDTVDAAALTSAPSVPARPALTRATSVHLTGRDADHFVGDLLTGDDQLGASLRRSKSVGTSALHKPAMHSPESSQAPADKHVFFDV